MLLRFCLAPLWLSVGLTVCGQDEPASPAAAEDPLAAATAEIHAAVADYVAAFNARDVDALVEMWTADGIYSVRSTAPLSGRDAIANHFQTVLADPETAPQLAAETVSVEFISPQVALEHGTAVVTQGDDVSNSEYSAVYVKSNGKWLIDRVTEEVVIETPSHYEQLKELEWMIGEWVDAETEFTVEIDCQWTANQNHISRQFRVYGEEGVISSGLQIIGWDAKEQQIRSWLFDSSGGFVSGTWTHGDEQWMVLSVATLADGSSGSFTSIFRPQSDGTYTWQKVNQVVDGQLLPNLDVVTIRPK